MSFDRTDVLRSDAVSVPVLGGDGTDVSVEVRAGNERIAGPVDAEAGDDERAVSVPLTDTGRTAVSGCAKPSFEVELRSGGRRVQALEVGATDSGPPCGRFFGPDAPWNQELEDDAPLDPSSPQRAAAMRAELERQLGRGFGPDINSSDYSTRVYTVPDDQPRVDVRLPPEKASFEGPFRDVPLPDDAQPAAGTDQHLVLYQPSTDTMWEFFGLERKGSGWLTEWGGRIDEVSASDGIFRPGEGGVKYGATASGLALAGGLITPGDLRRGRIDHALAFAVPKAMAGRFSLPAQRTDGWDRSAAAIPEGARLRLDPKLDLDRLELSPLSRMMAEAMQRYGIILRDQSGVTTFYAQIPTGSDSRDYYGRAKAGKMSSQVLAEIPWERLQLLRMDLRSPAGG